jgi:hypothetical protein
VETIGGIFGILPAPFARLPLQAGDPSGSRIVFSVGRARVTRSGSFSLRVAPLLEAFVPIHDPRPLLTANGGLSWGSFPFDAHEHRAGVERNRSP